MIQYQTTYKIGKPARTHKKTFSSVAFNDISDGWNPDHHRRRQEMREDHKGGEIRPQKDQVFTETTINGQMIFVCQKLLE